MMSRNGRQFSSRADRERIVVTGIGACTPLAGTAQGTWQRLLDGESALRDWDDLAAEGHRVVRACRVDGLDAPEARRGLALGTAAAREALESAGLAGGGAGTGGVFVGSTLGESAAFESVAAGAQLDLADYGVASFADGIAATFSLEGPRESLATACAAGNHAVGAAVLALRQRRAEWALAGGVEPFSRLALVGFSRSRAMASGDCMPFDARRTGMLLGEGAAFLVLETAERALGRRARPLAEVCGLGMSSDAWHPTAPRPDGRGMARALRAALAAADLSPDDVGWVNLHGTGTRASDAAEGRALTEVFTGCTMPHLTGSKGALGHALGAASAIEAVLGVCGLVDQVVPPTPGHQALDPEIGLACTRAPVTPRRPLRVVLSNAFAFGGINTTLVLRAWEAA